MAEQDDRFDLWFRRFRPAPESDVQLFCLPHAGGSATFFLPFAKLLAPTVEMVGVQYPGRQDRRNEPLVDDLNRLADQLSEVLIEYVDGPFALFGHSMGAALGFEVVRRIEAAGGPRPIGLVASGRRSPLTHRFENVHTRDDQGLLREIRELSGTDMALLDDEEFLQMILPVVRSDYRAIERYRLSDGSSVSCPIAVLVGESDPRVTCAEGRSWQQLTTGAFHFRTFPGGHFYLNSQQSEVVAAVRDLLRTFAAAVPGR